MLLMHKSTDCDRQLKPQITLQDMTHADSVYSCWVLFSYFATQMDVMSIEDYLIMVEFTIFCCCCCSFWTRVLHTFLSKKWAVNYALLDCTLYYRLFQKIACMCWYVCACMCMCWYVSKDGDAKWLSWQKEPLQTFTPFIAFDGFSPT